MQDSTADKDTEKENRLTRQAQEKIAALAEGNGLGASDVTLVATKEAWFEFPAELYLSLKPEITERRINGQSGDGKHKAGSLQELNRMIENAGHELFSDTSLTKPLIEKIEKSPGGGWGQNDVKYPLEALKREFFLSEHCGTCKGAARMPCRGCGGQGNMPCPQCYREGRIRCLTCGGDGRIQKADGTQDSCGFCRGTGFIICGKCGGQRMTGCTLCNGSRQESCTACGQTGWHTKISEVHFQVLTRFFPDLTKLPQTLRESLEKIGMEALALQKHARTKFLSGSEHEKDGVLILPYTAELPFALAQFRLKGKNLGAHVCGLNAVITKMPPFLDKTIENGFNALRRAAKGQGNPGSLITQACQYRVARDILLHCSGRAEKRVAQELFEKYKPALSPKFALALTHNAKLALRQTTRFSRYSGLTLGLLLTGGTFHGWFNEGVRPAIMKTLPSAQFAALVDFAAFLAGFLVSLFLVKFWARRALDNALTPARAKTTGMRTAQKKRPMPDAGAAGLWAFVLVLVIFVALAALSDAPPFWIRTFLARF